MKETKYLLSSDEKSLHHAVHVAGVPQVEEAHFPHWSMCAHTGQANVSRAPRG